MVLLFNGRIITAVNINEFKADEGALRRVRSQMRSQFYGMGWSSACI